MTKLYVFEFWLSGVGAIKNIFYEAAKWIQTASNFFCIETCVYPLIKVEFGETVAVMCIELYKQNMKQKRAAASLLKIDDDSNTMHFTFIALWLCLCFLGGIRYEETYKYFFTTIST